MKRTLRVAVPLLVALAGTYGIATHYTEFARYANARATDWREWRREKIALIITLDRAGKVVALLNGKSHGEPIDCGDFDAAYRLGESIETELRNRNARLRQTEIRLPATTPMNRAYVVTAITLLVADPVDFVALAQDGETLTRTRYAFGGCEHCAVQGRTTVAIEPLKETPAAFGLCAIDSRWQSTGDCAEVAEAGLTAALADLVKRGRDRREITQPDGLCLMFSSPPEMTWGALVTLLPKLKTPDVHTIYLAVQEDADKEWPDQPPWESPTQKRLKESHRVKMPRPLPQYSTTPAPTR